jgi:hypothetical protein
MESQTSMPNEQVTLLDHRLTAVERDLGELTNAGVPLAIKADMARLEIAIRNCATKEDMADIRAVLACLVTKADLLLLETRIMKWMITTLVGVAALNSTLVMIVVRLMHV